MGSIITGEAVVLELRPASFGARSLGAMIDFVAEAALLVGSFLALSAIPQALDRAAAGVVFLLLVLFFFILAPVALETATRGKSLGKLAMGLRIVRDDGGSIRVRHALIRALVGFFEIVLVLGAVAFLTSIFNERSKRLGDMMAGTYSLRERVPVVRPLVLDIPYQLHPWMQLVDIGRLPDGLSRRITSFLRQGPRMTPASRSQLAWALADEAAAYVAPSPPPGTPPELFLSALTAEHRNRELRRLLEAKDRSERLGGRLARLPYAE